MIVHRICRAAHAALDGEGARLHGGRWNLPGSRVVYASATLSLAALEMLVHADPDILPRDLVSVRIEIPDDIDVHLVEEGSLPGGWRSHPAPAALARIGEAWIERGATAVMSVPSAVITGERNFLLNPAHADFARIVVAGRAVRFALDRRLSPSR